MNFRILLLWLTGGVVAAAASPEPVTPFDTPGRWKAGDAGAWEWLGKDEGRQLVLRRQSRFKPPVRSPFNLIWLEGREWGEFELEVELRLTTFDQGNNDLCIAFAGRGAQEFYYAHLGEKADGVHHHIHLVNRADRKPVTSWRAGGTPWERGKWHKLRLVHRPATGEIVVHFDGKPVLKAVDKTLDGGRIGLGSFDDTGEFRRLVVRGGPVPADRSGGEP